MTKVDVVALARLSPLCMSALLLACGGDDSELSRTSSGSSVSISIGTSIDSGEGIDSSGDGIDSIGDGDGDPNNDGDGDPDDGDDDPDDTGGLKLDIGDGTTAGTADDGGEFEGCQKVDILFVIDNSGSMSEEQTSLLASFSGFVDGIQAELATADSYHVGVVTTDAYANNAPGCTGLGSLVTQTGGDAALGQDCLPFSSGKRYLDDTEPDLDAKFSCIAQVGISGSGDEIQAQSGYEAVQPAINAPGACNDGFIRDDALLVVVIITDEEDTPECIPFFGCLGGGSADNPPDWFQRYADAKNGIQENIVMLALIGTSAQNACGADHAVRLIALTNWFFNGTYGDICAPDYAPFFTDAISVIEDACDNFTPPE
jgi:hypothetical protein